MADSSSDPLTPQQIETLCLHGDAGIENSPDVSPPLHLATTYFQGNDADLVYSRNETITRRRLETLLGKLEGGHAITYASGLAAAYAALRYLRPQRVAVDRGYHGTQLILKRLQSEGVALIDLDVAPREGDVVWLETPKNPTCELNDIQAISDSAHKAGAKVVVDSTFASPVLQQPLFLGADIVMHSSTKFIGGHSDLLGGVLAAKDPAVIEALYNERTVMGSVPGSLETWLTLRSLRTMPLRVMQQCRSASQIAEWLESRVARVWHPSLRSHPQYALAQRQMRGPGGVLSLELASEDLARALPSKLRLFNDATSLGGVESLIEWRKLHDPNSLPTLVRLSIGLESPEDLIADLEQAL